MILTVVLTWYPSIPAATGAGVSRTSWRSDATLADGGYDSAAFREWLHDRRMATVIPQRGRKKIIGLGRIRWVVEQAIAHLHQFKRPSVRWDRHLFMHQGFTKP